MLLLGLAVTCNAWSPTNPDAFWRVYQECNLRRLEDNTLLTDLDDLLDAAKQIHVECSDAAAEAFYLPLPPLETTPSETVTGKTTSGIVLTERTECPPTFTKVYQTIDHCQLQSSLHEWCTSRDAPTQLDCLSTQTRECRKIKTSLTECFCV